MRVFALITVAVAQESNQISRLQAQIDHFQNVTSNGETLRTSNMIRMMEFQLGIENWFE